jgi:hypothetical protein
LTLWNLQNSLEENQRLQHQTQAITIKITSCKNMCIYHY